MLAAQQRSQPARPLTAAGLRRIHTTLMSGAEHRRHAPVLPLNPASYVELDTGRRPKAVVWTKQREAHWRATGERPKVAVWLPGDADRQPADPPTRRRPRDRRAQERERRAHRRSGHRHRCGPAAAPDPAAGGAPAVGSCLDRHRLGLHRRGRHCSGARPRPPAVRPPAQGGRPAAGPLARPAPRGRNPGTGRRREPEGGLGDARPLHHRHHGGHLHQRAARGRPGSRRSRGPAGAPADVSRTSRPHSGPSRQSTTPTRGFAGDDTAGQRRAWDSNPRNESPRSAVFKTAAIGL